MVEAAMLKGPESAQLVEESCVCGAMAMFTAGRQFKMVGKFRAFRKAATLPGLSTWLLPP